MSFLILRVSMYHLVTCLFVISCISMSFGCSALGVALRRTQFTITYTIKVNGLCSNVLCVSLPALLELGSVYVILAGSVARCMRALATLAMQNPEDM